jgi:hypothetical protein
MKSSRPLLRLIRDVDPATPCELQAIQDATLNRRSEAPAVILDALMWAFREGGLKALDQPVNKERISRLSHAQRDELRDRMKRWANG